MVPVRNGDCSDVPVVGAGRCCRARRAHQRRARSRRVGRGGYDHATIRRQRFASTVTGHARNRPEDETFIPYIEVFRSGDKVVFHNSDNTRHHAYSFAPARQFEFVLAPGESSAPLQLDKLGVIAVGCNIHDHMITYLYVTDAPHVAHSGGDGIAQLSNLPKGDYAVRVWHPLLRPGIGVDVQRLTINEATELKDLEFTLSLLPDPRLPPDRERSGY